MVPHGPKLKGGPTVGGDMLPMGFHVGCEDAKTSAGACGVERSHGMCVMTARPSFMSASLLSQRCPPIVATWVQVPLTLRNSWYGAMQPKGLALSCGAR